MVGQIASLLITVYLLFFLPVLLGTLFIRGKEKEIGTAYLNGMILLLGVFLAEAYAADYFNCSLSGLALAYAVTAGIISVGALVIFAASASRFRLPVLYRYHYLAVIVVMLLFVGLRQDTSADSVLETALTAVWSDRMFAFSPYTGHELVSHGFFGYLPAFYGALSKLSGLHVTLIGKLLMPFCTVLMAMGAYRLLLSEILGKDTKRSWYGLWFILFLWLFLCFPELPGYYVLWEAAWTPESLVYICFVPMLVYLLSKRKWNWRFSVLLAFLVMDMGLSAGEEMRKAVQGALPFLFLLFLASALFKKRILWMLKSFVCLCRKRNVKNYVFFVSLSALAVLSAFLGGCVITNSAYAMPDNRYKINGEIMQIRIMAEPVEKPRMLAPPEVSAQIRDGDLKVFLLLGPKAGEYTGTDVTLIRQKEIAHDLALNGYDSMKLIQHATAEGCNMVVAYKAGEEQEKIFEQFGYLKMGETDSYEVYGVSSRAGFLY